LKFQVHPMIQQFINYYQARGRSTMEIGLNRSGQFTRMARRIFREEGVPENLVWLGQVESAWKPWARSWAAASGLWQFIPGTGIRYGLRQTAYIDERHNYEKATRASARYLKFLANRLVITPAKATLTAQSDALASQISGRLILIFRAKLATTCRTFWRQFWSPTIPVNTVSLTFARCRRLFTTKFAFRPRRI
jgi:hypothetical protein